MSFDEILQLFREDWLVALNKIWLANMLGVVAWALVSVPLGLALYFSMKPVFRKVMYRKGQPAMPEKIIM